MVVLDCLYWAHNQKENDSSEMKSLMRQLVELRETYGIVVMVVHHTKKGTRFETMHNDNMRGSSVFDGATDTVFMFRRSSTDETKRLLKPTKLRHGGDENRKTRLLELDNNTLWFRDHGEADEKAHMPMVVAPATIEAKVDWEDVFGDDQTLERKDILTRLPGKPPRSVDRLLKDSVKSQLLVKDSRGEYSLPKKDPVSDDSQLPAAA